MTIEEELAQIKPEEFIEPQSPPPPGYKVLRALTENEKRLVTLMVKCQRRGDDPQRLRMIRNMLGDTIAASIPSGKKNFFLGSSGVAIPDLSAN